jgi:ribonuclease HI
MEIERTEKYLKITQKQRIEEILKRFDMDQAKPQPTPMIDPKRKKFDNINNQPTDKEKLQQIVGALTWISKRTRPDIAFAVNYLARKTQPTEDDLVTAKRIMRYLKGTIDHGLTYDTTATLEGYVDADYANDPSRHSTTGYIFMLNGGPVSWSTRKQPVIALSSTEAEFIAITEAVREANSLSKILTELNIKHQPITINEDNQSAIKLTTTKNHHEKTKHIDIKYHYIKHEISNNKIQIKYKPTEIQIADNLTKALNFIKIQHFNNLMNLTKKNQK